MTTITAQDREPNILENVSDAIRPLYGILPLLIILVFHSVVSLSSYNLADHDEALYIMTGQKFMETETITEAMRSGLYLSGTPYLYPVLAGHLDTIGGLSLARSLSLVFILIAISNMYFLTLDLFDKPTAIVAAIIFAAQPSIIFMSNFATFDAMALGLVTCATTLAIRASHGRGFLSVVLCGLYIMVAAMSKYAVVAFAPFVAAVMFWQTFRRINLKTAFFYTTTITIIPIIGLGLLLFFDPYIRQGLTYTTTGREAMGPMTASELFGHILSWSGPSLLIVLLGLFIYMFVNPFSQTPILKLPKWVPDRLRCWLDLTPLIIVMVGTTFLAPMYHMYKGEATSLHKHLGYGFMGGAPIVAFALISIGLISVNSRPKLRWALPLALAAAIYAAGIPQGKAFFTSWEVNVRSIQAVLRDDSIILSDDTDFLCYNTLGKECNITNWIGIYGITYVDPNGITYHGDEAYAAAVENAYFDLVIFTHVLEPQLTTPMQELFVESGNYILVEDEEVSIWGTETQKTIWHIRPEVAENENRGYLLND